MKLTCNVEVYNRLANLAPNIARRKPQRSCLAIGRQSVKNQEIHLLLQTPTNKNGTKYKVDNNIEKVFTRCINEGKATIRLKEPPHDINISCDPIQLKSFLHVLKLGLSKKLDPAVLTLSNLNPKPIKAPPKTKIVIKQTSEYPVLQGFPRTTEELCLAGLQRKSFDRQILKLQSLRILNLSDNNITSLPRELGTLAKLQELNVSGNQLGKGPISKWSWLSCSNIAKNLRLLNLSNNQMSQVPEQINKLGGLVTLYLDNNLFSYLPPGIGSLNRLKFLYLAKNNLSHLPGSMRNLRLFELNVCDNKFDNNANKTLSVCNIKVPSLVDWAARVVLQSRTFYDASIIPYTLIQYLDKAKYCMCGAPCFDCFIRRFMSMNLSLITQSFKFSGTAGNDILFDCYFCSIRCVRKFKGF
ncbi:leucine-rich repeat protein 1 [Nasonia vitripennis]|uniref:PIF1/LRR1 pleckstrin homology domain-containing protein n=1 Tax=Nasonia vitripennis TaxID=7425 RepID=A0A7M7QTH7_NASVI|nr:leucine-rich repeat protein 1 [Nasonia vitripennis]XP_016837510.1 leucine-rich repeat protein 1 [Nasonia vitripennis]XP_032453442.1 leucine-rich repeat protein 1 [Nasonia vitripennis]